MTDQTGTGVPHSARVWNYWLGGKDHYVIDARLGRYCASFYPGMTVLARSCRYFTARVISCLAAAGIRQFLDVGCGLPAPAGNIHQMAQAIAPDAHIVYTDHDPLVLAHARARLTCGPPGRTSHLPADLSDPAALLDGARGLLDFRQPVAVLAINVLGHLGDPAHDNDHATRALVAQLAGGLPPGSYLAIADRTSTDPCTTWPPTPTTTAAPLPTICATPPSSPGSWTAFPSSRLASCPFTPGVPTTAPSRPSLSTPGAA